MKKLLLLLWLCSCTATFAQKNSSAYHKAEDAREAIAKALGGYKALNAINFFSYSILKTSYGTDTVTVKTDYTLDLGGQYVQERQLTKVDTVVRWTDATGSWILKNGNKAKLSEDDAKRLQRVLLTNFITMIRNSALEYVYMESTTYKGRQADIVRVYTPDKQSLILDLFVDKKNGEILTSSKPDPETGKYTYYADELDYQHIGEGLRFPLVYQVWVGGKVVTEGRFIDVEVKK